MQFESVDIMLFNFRSRGLKDMDGKVYHEFDHPWFQTLIMFTGEAMCLFGLIYQRRKQKREAAAQVFDIKYYLSVSMTLNQQTMWNLK